jgi:protocatechuate 4,5-dioxygenase beta chain
MAEVIGGVGISHIPLLGRLIDSGESTSDRWRDVFDGFDGGARWLQETKPDVAVVVYNDHGAAISLDMMPTFAIGLADEFQIADEGRGARAIPPVPGVPDLAWHIAESAVADGFDLALAQELDVDHGLTVPLSMLWGTPTGWPVPVIPLAVNVVQQPTPSAQRCFDLGRAIGAAVSSFGQDLRVVVIGTGGMSHQLQGARAGLINQDFDHEFLDAIGPDPQKLTGLTVSDYIRLAGSEGSELVMWMVMRGALPESVRTSYRFYHAPISSTGGGVIVLEP